MSRKSVIRGSIAIGFLGLVLFFQNCAQSSGTAGPSETDLLKEDIQTLSKSAVSSPLDSTLEVLNKRRQLLLELAKQSPQAALEVAMQPSQRELLPAAIQDQVEQEQQVTGTLEKYYEDYADGRHVVRHMLRLGQDRRYEVRFAERDPSEKLLNKPVSVKGLRILRNSQSVEADLVVTDSSKDLYLLDGSSEDVAYDIDIVNSTLSKGEQKTLVILVNFEDDPNNKPWTVSSIQDLVFNSVTGFINESSSQQTWLTGHVAGWYTIPISSTVCDGFGIESRAKQAAQNSGYVLSNYSRFVYMFPKNACGYTGMGQVGSETSSAWINNSAILRTVGHELIHGFGAHHAHAKDCGDVSIGSSCSTHEYGNTVDIMGYSGTVGHLNAVYKERLGWFSSSSQIVRVTASGDYFIVPSSVSSNSAKTLKIYAGIDSSSSSEYYYHVEFRQPVGYDSMIQDRGVIDVNNIFNGVIVQESRKMSNSGAYDSYMLDMTPGTNFVDMKDAALTVGNSFSDPASGVTITTLSASSSGAMVRVQLGAGSPPPADTTAPSVSISSPTNGSTVSGTIGIAASASDNVGVSKVEFYVDGVLKGTDTTSPYSLSFDTKTVSNGSHVLMAKAFDAANNSSSHQISVNVSNLTADTTAPSVSISSPASGSTVSGTISIAASANDNVGVSKVEFYVDGVLKGTDTTSPYSLSFDTKTVSNGSHVLMAKAFDAANNSSSHQISVNVSNLTADTTAPNVSITSPANGAVFDARTTITIQANASDNVSVARVDFYVDGSLICSDTTASYSCSYKLGSAKGATYNLSVIAYDSSNNTRSHAISISTAGGGGPGGGGGGPSGGKSAK